MKAQNIKDNKESKQSEGAHQDIEVLYQNGDTSSKEYMLVFKYNGMRFRIRIQHKNGTPLGFNYKCCLQVMLPDGTFANLVDCSDLRVRWQNQYFIQNIDQENNKRAIEAFKDYVKKVYS